MKGSMNNIVQLLIAIVSLFSCSDAREGGMIDMGGSKKSVIDRHQLRSSSRSKSILTLRGGSSMTSSSAETGALPYDDALSRIAELSATETVESPNMDDLYHNHSPLALTCAHWMSTSDCLHSLRVDENIGLSLEEAGVRKIQFGSNTLKEPLKKPIWHLIAEQFEDRLVQILLGVAVLSSFLAAVEKDVHAFTEPIIITSILVLNAAVGVWQSKSSENSLDALKRLQPESACVLRNGIWQGELPIGDIVPGDVIYLRVGDKVPADARIISLKTTTFSTDESTLTGESLMVPKTPDPVDAASSISGKSNMVFSGTMVANGGAYAVVTSTGAVSEIGKINQGVMIMHYMSISFSHAFSALLTEKI
jgi:magnesium-transporting ATPase (P-type)